jgi:hypothetical protein
VTPFTLVAHQEEIAMLSHAMNSDSSSRRGIELRFLVGLALMLFVSS